MPQAERVIRKEIVPRETEAGVAKLWDFFDDFTRIPRKTRSEQDMTAMAEQWAESNKFQRETDSMGNVLVLIPATEGNEGAPGVIMQAHSDMVCVGKPDPAKHGVNPKLSADGKWLTGNNTSLGADNGIGLAAGFALAEDDIEHGPLALMITVNEEVGLIGAMGMDFQTPLDSYKYLINFDSEREGEAIISCGGGGDSIIELAINTEPIENKVSFKISVENLLGGHSGLEIHEQRLNGIIVLTEALSVLGQKIGSFRLVNINGGGAPNVIPSNVEATIAIDNAEAEKIQGILDQTRSRILEKPHLKAEKNLALKLSQSEQDSHAAMTKDSTNNVINLLSELPHGVIKTSQEVEGLVQTSTNLAVVETVDGKVNVQMMTRSCVDSELEQTRENIRQIAAAHEATVEETIPYPGWPANPENEIIEIAREEWEHLTGEELIILSTHAGLECGAIIGKYSHLEAISIGPTISGAHSKQEKVKIDTVPRFYKFAKSIIQKISTLQN